MLPEPFPEPWQMHILVPLAIVGWAVVWAIRDFQRDSSLYSQDTRRHRRRALTKFCLQVAVAAAVGSLFFYATSAAGLTEPQTGIALLVIIGGGAGAWHWLRRKRRQATTHPPE